MKKLSVILVAVLMTGCLAARLKPTQSDADRGSAKFHGYNMAQLTEGKALYENNCATCHALKKPSSESEQEWRRIVPAMVGKVNKNSIVLDSRAEDLILKYVVTMGGR